MPSMKHDYQLQRFDKLDSTNDWLKRNYASQMDGSVILAKQQTKGRGRFERTWESNEDLTFSILYKQAFPYPIIFPLALVKALESFGMQAMIKWPNDILLNGKKVCGILIETVYEGSQKAAMIVGIGINVTQKKGELADKAGYVAVDKEELLQAVLTQLSVPRFTVIPETLHKVSAKGYCGPLPVVRHFIGFKGLICESGRYQRLAERGLTAFFCFTKRTAVCVARP